MPAAVAAYISTATLTAASVLTAAQITAMTYAAFAVGAVAVGNYQRRKARRKAIAAYNASLEDRLVMLSTVSGPRSRCYGRVRNVDGVLFKATRGADKEFYTLVIALAGHEVDAIETVYFNDKPVTLDANGYVQDEPYLRTDKSSGSQTVTLNGSGGATVNMGGAAVAGSASAVQLATESTDETVLTVSTSGSTLTISGGAPGATATATWQVASATSYARVRMYTGAPGQDLSTVLQPLFPDLITAGVHRFAGIACLLVDLEFNPDAFSQGVPDISAVFRGAKVLDPRTGLTAWTQNPALHARDWALYSKGGGITAADINDASFTAAANACDVSTGFVTDSGTQTLPLYTSNIVCKLDDDPWGVFLEMVEAMAGKAGWAGGQLRVAAGVYRAPVVTITEDWVTDREPVQVVPEPPADEAVNVYRPTISDAAQAYVVVPAPEVRAASYITADGRELAREITLGAVTDTVHAQHVCGVLMRDARNALSVVLPCNLRAFSLELFDVVSVTLPRFGWTAKTFEVVDWQFSLQGGVTLTLKETAAAIFQPDTGFDVLDLTPNTALPDPSVVPTIGTLTVTSGTSVLSDGTQVTRARVQWPAPADRSVSASGVVQVQYWPSTQALPSGDWIAAPDAPGNALETTIAGLKASSAYTFRARFVNALGVRGAWGVQRTHRTADPPAPAWTDIAGKPADSAILNSYQTIGQNLLAESDQAAAVRFVVGYNPNGATLEGGAVRLAAGQPGWDTTNWVLSAGRTRNVFARQIGRHTGTGDTEADSLGNTVAVDFNFSGDVPAIPGQRLFASCFVVAQRCKCRVYLTLLDAAGNSVAFAVGAESVAPVVAANALGAYERLSVAVTVPAGVALARLVLRKYNTFAGQSDSYVWWAAPQVEVAAAQATGPSPYMPGPASAVGQLGYVGDLNATRGAPAGTLVGGTAAEAVEANAANALSNAATAQSAANTANAAIADSAADNKLSPVEKQRDVIIYQSLLNDQAGLNAEADRYGITTEKATLATVLTALASNVGPLLANLTTTSDITGTAYRGYFADALAAKQALLNRVAEEAGKRAQWSGVSGTGKPQDNATVGAPAGTLVGSTPAQTVEANAANALSNAAAAQSAANTANAAIADSAADNKLSPVEKQRDVIIYQSLLNDQAGLNAEADRYGITTEKANLATVLTALANNVGPLLANLATTSDITGTTYRGYFADALNAKQALLNRVAEEAGKRAQWSGVSGTGRPSDNATADLTLVNHGGTVTVQGNSLIKAASGNTDATWDSGVYSRESYTGGAFVSFTAAQTDKRLMIGLNTGADLGDAGYLTLDWAIYIDESAGVYSFESGAGYGPLSTYVVGDALAVTYDGYRVRFMKNGTVLREVVANITAPLFLDSSFYHRGARADRVVFGPMSAVANIQTPQIQPGAVTGNANGFVQQSGTFVTWPNVADPVSFSLTPTVSAAAAGLFLQVRCDLQVTAIVTSSSVASLLVSATLEEVTSGGAFIAQADQITASALPSNFGTANSQAGGSGERSVAVPLFLFARFENSTGTRYWRVNVIATAYDSAGAVVAPGGSVSAPGGAVTARVLASGAIDVDVRKV